MRTTVLPKEQRLHWAASRRATCKRMAIAATTASPPGRAFTYAQNQWPNLMTLFEDGRLLIDNNLIENKIRPLALG